LIKYSQNPSGGFGNRLFQFNFLAQIATACNTQYQYRSLQDKEILSNCIDVSVSKLERMYPSIKIESIKSQKYDDVISQINHMLTKKKIVRIQGITLGETFSEFTKVSPRELLKINLPAYKFKETTVAIHFRGGDFKNWNSSAILPIDYYERAIEYLMDSQIPPKNFYLVTDDPTLESYRAIKDKYSHFIRNNYQTRTQLVNDFSLLQNATYLISSPSTFAIWSSILGNHKKVMHSKSWMDSRLEAEDPFWVDLQFHKSDFLPTVTLI